MAHDLKAALEEKGDLLLALVAVAVAFAVRYHFLATYNYPMMIHEQDAVGYMETARDILQLKALNMGGRPPGYPLVIALFSPLPVSFEQAARIASIFMDALAALPLFFLARVYLSRIPACAVVLLWAFFSVSLVFSPSPLSQSSYLCYLLFGIVLLHRGMAQRQWPATLAAGFSFGLAFVTRPEAIVAFACGFLLSLIPLWSRKERTATGAYLPLAFLVGFFLLAAPYLISFHSQMGYWGITAKSEAALKTQDGTMILNAQGELERTKPGVSVWKEYYGTLPVFAKAVGSNLVAYCKVYLSTFPLWMHLVSLAGLVALPVLFGVRQTCYLLILVAVTAPNYIVNVSKTHSYIYSVFPATFICFLLGLEWIAQGARRLGEQLRMSQAGLRSGGILAALAVVSVFSLGSYRAAEAEFESPGLVSQALLSAKIFREAGEFIKSRSQKSDRIMTRWGLVGYFADRPLVTLPKGGVQEVLDYGRRNGARFVLIDTGSVLSRRQELMPLLDPLEGKKVDPALGIDVVGGGFYPDVGGYVIYCYRGQGT